MDDAPQQPVLAPNDPSVNKHAVRAHRDAVMAFAREHPGAWVTYWESPTKVSARKVKRNLTKSTVGDWPVMTRDYVSHGHNFVDMFSLRIEGTQVQVRYNGPYYQGAPLVPEEAPPAAPAP